MKHRYIVRAKGEGYQNIETYVQGTFSFFIFILQAK